MPYRGRKQLTSLLCLRTWGTLQQQTSATFPEKKNRYVSHQHLKLQSRYSMLIPKHTLNQLSYGYDTYQVDKKKQQFKPFSLTLLTFSLELCALNVFHGLQAMFEGMLFSGVLSSTLWTASAVMPLSSDPSSMCNLDRAVWYFSGAENWFEGLHIDFKVLDSSWSRRLSGGDAVSLISKLLFALTKFSPTIKRKTSNWTKASPLLAS